MHIPLGKTKIPTILRINLIVLSLCWIIRLPGAFLCWEIIFNVQFYTVFLHIHGVAKYVMLWKSAFVLMYFPLTVIAVLLKSNYLSFKCTYESCNYSSRRLQFPSRTFCSFPNTFHGLPNKSELPSVYELQHLPRWVGSCLPRQQQRDWEWNKRKIIIRSIDFKMKLGLILTSKRQNIQWQCNRISRETWSNTVFPRFLFLDQLHPATRTNRPVWEVEKESGMRIQYFQSERETLQKINLVQARQTQLFSHKRNNETCNKTLHENNIHIRDQLRIIHSYR